MTKVTTQNKNKNKQIKNNSVGLLVENDLAIIIIWPVEVHSFWGLDSTVTDFTNLQRYFVN